MAMGENSTDLVTYTEDYLETAFFTWYQAGCPSVQQLLDLLPKDQNGRLPSQRILYRWMNLHHWRERADVLDMEVQRKMEQQAIDERIAMLERQAGLARKLQNMGEEFFDNENALTQENVALNMILKGVELERNSVGIPEVIKEISTMKDDQLVNLIRKLLGSVPRDELEDLVEGEFKEIEE